MLSASAVDGLLSVVSAGDASFASLLSAVAAARTANQQPAHQQPATPFQTRCACAMLLDGGDAADQATLRPHQRLAALYIMARLDDPTTVAVQLSPASSTHLAQLSRNPFLEALVQHLDRSEVLLPAVGLPAPVKASPALLERCFILQLLLPHLFPRLAPLEQASPRSWSEHAAAYVLQEPATLQSAIAPSPLTEALAPIRKLVRDLQPSASLLPPLMPVAPLFGELVVSAAHLTSVLGDGGAASIQSALFPAPSAAPASSFSFRFAPPLPRLAPPPILDIEWSSLAPDFGPEASWMRWDPPADLVWDVVPPSLLAPPSPAPPSAPLSPSSLSTPLAQLLTKALKSQLLAAERTQLLQELKTPHSPPLDLSPALTTCLQLVPPARLPQLVEKNHEIARELLLQLMALNLSRATAVAAAASSSASAVAASFAPLPFTVNEYLSALVQMDMSLHSMELVKDLALVDQVSLPGDFLQLYICRCLASCSKLQDKFLQNRHVRLICVFLQALMRHKLIQLPVASPAHSVSSSGGGGGGESSSLDVRDVLLVEVQSFLVEFSRIKEAANLYKQIKQLEATHA